jgi:dUTP pyrophosphatase
MTAATVRQMNDNVETMTIQIKQMDHAAGLPLPAYATENSAGCDVVAAVDAPVTLAAGAIAIIPTGLCVALPAGFELQVRARSGLAAKNGIGLVNGIGTIDADYRGEIKIIIINHGQQDFVIERGMRIAQFVIARHETVRFQITTELSETARGTGGLGSTGK